MTIARYFVDERGWCIAVRDMQNTDEHYPGLDPDVKGVVAYWQGEYKNTECPTCGKSSGKMWFIRPDDRTSAHKVCEYLNQADKLLPKRDTADRQQDRMDEAREEVAEMRRERGDD